MWNSGKLVKPNINPQSSCKQDCRLVVFIWRKYNEDRVTESVYISYRLSKGRGYKQRGSNASMQLLREKDCEWTAIYLEHCDYDWVFKAWEGKSSWVVREETGIGIGDDIELNCTWHTHLLLLLGTMRRGQDQFQVETFFVFVVDYWVRNSVSYGPY